MKRRILSLVILGLLTGSMSVSAIMQNNEKDRGYISLSTSANTEVAPDVAEISLAIKTSDTKSMQKAANTNKEISDKVYALLKSMLNAQNGDYIKTSDYSASPIYIYSNNKKNLDKYEVSNRVIVHTKSIDKIGTMIDKAMEAGATNVDSLKFSVSNYESQCNSLIETAVKKANTRANAAVKSAGAILDGVKSIDVSCSENKSYNTPRMYMAKNVLSAVAEGVSDSAEPATSISSGVIKIFANANVVYFVK